MYHVSITKRIIWQLLTNIHNTVNIITASHFCIGQHFPLDPILSRFHISSLADVNPGDHVMLNSQHYLVSRVRTDAGFFSAFTINNNGSVTNKDIKLSQSKMFIRVDYNQQSDFYNAKMVERATEELEKKSKWSSSDYFVSMMKCGRKCVVTERCLFEADVEPIGCTLVTPRTAVDVGDHLLVQRTSGEYQSVLVYSCMDEHTIVSMPKIQGKGLMGELNLCDYKEVQRVNYKQTLPIEEIFRRSNSLKGKQMLLEGGGDATQFISWAKVGRETTMSLEKLLQRQQIAGIRPQVYEKVVSTDSIMVGDHLFIPYPAYRWPFLVCGKIKDGSGCTRFKLTYIHCGTVKESDEVLDALKDDIFKVVYAEEYAPSIAVKRATSLLGKFIFRPMAHMWFTRWAKTGSDDGLEIDFLKRQSLPVCKSRISCFTQLEPGDYLVVDKGRFSPRHHYLVTKVVSPRKCFVIGAWLGKVQETRIQLDEGVPHKIVYEEGSCLSSAESIQRARDAIGSPFIPKHTTRKFVNFVKTTDATDVDVESLLDDRFLLRRERVESIIAADMKPGDHLEIPVKNSLKVAYRNLIVTDIINETKVRVMCVNPKRGGDIVEMDFDLEREGEMYRVKYVERVGLREGLDMLQRFSVGNLSKVSDKDRLFNFALVPEEILHVCNSLQSSLSP